MIPLRDENPAHRPPIITVVLILACVAAFVVVQPSATRSLVRAPDTGEILEEIEFSYEHAAIPCELVQQRPLSLEEIRRTVGEGDSDACRSDLDSAPRPFPDKSIWLSVVVSMFLHGSWIHLIGNMVFLWVFGNNIEDHLGHARYVAFYLAAGAVATGAHVGLQLDSTVPLVGASGAIAGVMGAYLVWFPWARVRTLILLGFIPLWPRIPAALLLAGWFVMQFFTDPNARIAWAAHVGGFAFGAVMALEARRHVGFRNRLWHQQYRVTGKGPWDNRRGPGVNRVRS